MSTTLVFTDGTGAATLRNGLPAPADRFSNWTPDVDPVGDREAALGTGITSHWSYRDDYLATFDLEYLPASSHPEALRLKRHLETGGTVTVNTGDVANRSYTCRIAPGARVAIEFASRSPIHYTLRLHLKNTAAAPLLCIYPGWLGVS